MRDVRLVFPHQLFATPPVVPGCDKVLLVEEPLYFTQFPFHKQKLLLQRASLRYYQNQLQQMGWQTRYLECHDPLADVRELLPALAADGVKVLHVTEVCDDWLQRRLEQAAAANHLSLAWHASPQFLTDTTSLATQFGATRRKYLHNNFYSWQRQRLGLLLDAEGKPQGGQWSFDADNRKPWPKQRLPPPLPQAAVTPWHIEGRQWVQEHFPRAPGSLEGALHYPVTHAQADAWLDDFLQQRFAGFGTWEDAIAGEAAVLQHSVLTPMLNNGLLLPATVLQKTLAFAEAQRVPLNDTEGFVRQLVGWREFVRGLYLHHGRQQRCANYWGFTQPMPRAFYDASTGIEPVDAVIRKVLHNGYCHHIERLMILGCFMLISSLLTITILLSLLYMINRVERLASGSLVPKLDQAMVKLNEVLDSTRVLAEQARQSAGTVTSSTTFVAEQVVSPVIRIASLASGVRAAATTLARRSVHEDAEKSVAP